MRACSDAGTYVSAGQRYAYSYRTDRCEYRDADGWHVYAQEYARSVLKVDLSRFKHRMLVMPRGWTYEAGCPWNGLGTLGPDERGPNGEFLSSQAWMTGEMTNQIMSVMHEVSRMRCMAGHRWWHAAPHLTRIAACARTAQHRTGQRVRACRQISEAHGAGRQC